MSAPQISFVTTCKGRLEHLRQSLPLMAAQQPIAEVVLVDFDCPDGAGAWARAALPAVTVVQARDRPRFSAAAARNLGAAAARAPWLVFLDADILAHGDLAGAIAARVAPGRFLLADPRPPPLWGALAVSAQDFAAVGGYDEAFQGWGAEDDDLVDRLLGAGLAAGSFPAEGLAAITHDDALRTAHHAETDLRLNALVNSFYRSVKRDLARLGVELSAPNRLALYDDVRRSVTRAAGGETALLQVGFRRAWTGMGATLASLGYEIRPPARS